MTKRVHNDQHSVLVRPEQLREGLIRGESGAPLSIRVHLDRSPGYAMPAGIFEFDSAFPGPGVFGYLRAVGSQVSALVQPRLSVFGHADAAGAEHHNKLLSERRAKVIVAMLTGDLELFEQVAEDDDWLTNVYQRMLTLLGHDAGEPDGQVGPLTQAATRGFQEDYNGLLYHLNFEGKTRAYDDLVVDGKLGRKTREALCDAYLSQAPTRLPKSAFAETAYAGCSEFNLLESPEKSRRVTVVPWQFDRPSAGDFPCKEEDESACPLREFPAGADPSSASAASPREGRVTLPVTRRCKFYSYFVAQEQELQGRERPLGTAGNSALLFFDSDWQLHQISETFQLVGDQGYDETLGASDLQPQGEHGMRLEFKGLSPGESYTLYQHFGGGVKLIVFSGVPYADVVAVRQPSERIAPSEEGAPEGEAEAEDNDDLGASARDGNWAQAEF